MMMKSLVAAAICLWFPVVGMAELTEEAVNDKVAEIQAWMGAQSEEPSQAEIQEKLNEVTSDIDVTGLSMNEISRGAFLLMEAEATRNLLQVRVDVLALGRDASAAEAAIMGMFLALRGSGAGLDDYLKKVLGHPGLDAMLENGKGFELFGVMAHLPPELLASQGPAIAGLIDLVPDNAGAQNLMALSGYVGALGELGESVSEERVMRIQQRVVELHTAAIAKAREANAEEDVQMLEAGLGYVKGAAARGQLIGQPAPMLNLEWNSKGMELSNLGDLKGKVVVIDFWATWCGPCIGSFPNLRELRKHYDLDDVVILGVTSLQGSHYARGKPPVDTADDPAREYALMAEFINQMDITWTVAFSRQDVFNHDFGVQGIPHVAIIAADGTVRYNGLSPHGDLEEKTSKIDGLLAEMKKSL